MAFLYVIAYKKPPPNDEGLKYDRKDLHLQLVLRFVTGYQGYGFRTLEQILPTSLSLMYFPFILSE
jgi:hypothetical protein